MIRVGFSLDTFDLGGFELACLDLVSRLDPTRFEAHLYSFRPGRLVADAAARGHPVNVGYAKPAEDHTWTAEDSTARVAYRDGLAAALTRDNIDLLVAWGWGDAVDAGLRAGISHIIERLDGPVLVSRVGDKSACERIVCESAWIRSLVQVQRRALRADPERLLVIPNGIDLVRFDPERVDRATARAALGLETGDIAVVNVARLSPEKGQEQLIAAAALLRDLLPANGPRVLVFLVGPDGGQEAALRERVQAARLEQVVRFLGSRSDIPEVLRAADIFCLPSIYEGSPFALLEAMAMGLPAVCTPVGGVLELLDDNAILVPALESYPLARALARLATDAPERERLGRRSRELAAGFDVCAMVQRYETLFEDVVAEPRRVSAPEWAP